ncbi:hypothetical protein BDV59DRAFT_180908 [Aspergillus ambiguus]|uniref:uncharacterized protein n=1 Tax=Aspergillus ambiguus TaxID=176160 RepID=UPI003CCE3D1C
MSGVINKVKDAVTGHHGSGETANHGPHHSKLANKLDPRVDGTNAPQSTGFVTSETTTAARPVTSGTKATNTGPHDSNMANKIDPRVDSDRDNRARHQEMGGTYGPHNSNLANKADPRVDSDIDNRSSGVPYNTSVAYATGARGSTTSNASGVQTTTYTPTTAHGDTSTRTFEEAQHTTTTNEPHFSSNHTGPTTRSSTAGPHGSNMMNKLDPRVDSDRDNRARHASMASSSYNTPGTTSSTTGPHTSNMANKLDPRVDSDMDNRQNFGGQRSYGI